MGGTTRIHLDSPCREPWNPHSTILPCVRGWAGKIRGTSFAMTSSAAHILRNVARLSTVEDDGGLPIRTDFSLCRVNYPMLWNSSGIGQAFARGRNRLRASIITLPTR